MLSNGVEDETTAKRRALLIAGPTASGKSAVAFALARRFDATIVNTDSMQVYRDLRVLTARPSPEEEGQADHALFGVVDGAINHSVGLWMAEARVLAEWAFWQGRLAIFVGGTGLYFRALTEGLSDIPAVPEMVRQRVRAEAEGLTTPDLHARLASIDAATAARLRPSDRQRVLRALEVREATGQPLTSFQSARQPPFLRSGEWAGLFLAPERTALDSAIDRRFETMIEKGALDEVAALAERRLDPALPVMRAHGAPSLMSCRAGRATLEEAKRRAKLDTRQYSKRQFTWARHQMKHFAWTAPNQAIDAGARALEALS
jgi:tRNA dimethylallyltransferase